jgi:mono/diheme cytochrome c family protein
MSAHIITGLFFLAFTIVSPATVAAQAPPGSGAGTPRTAAEQRGEAQFVKTCMLCHNLASAISAQARATGVVAPDFIGLFKRPGITEEYVRQMTRVGIPGQMPGYQYTYTPDELDDLIAYLKIR